MSLIVDIKKKLGSFQLTARLEAPPGQALALLGPSGCGKSVTLKCIAGLMAPDSGVVELDGRILYHSGKGIDIPPQQRRVGYLFQSYALFPHMTVAENIRCGLKRKDRAKLPELIDRFRLSGLEGLYPGQLSGGQQQRTALARMLASAPQAALLDEPLAALDSFLKWELELELNELMGHFDGPVIWVSHDLGECRRNCVEVCPMDGGRTAPVTSMDALLQSPSTLTQARLAGCKCFARVQARPGGAAIPEWGLTLDITPPKPSAMLGVPAGAAAIGAGFPCTVVRIIPGLGRAAALLRPVGAQEGAPLIYAEPESTEELAEGMRVEIELLEERLLWLDG